MLELGAAVIADGLLDFTKRLFIRRVWVPGNASATGRPAACPGGADAARIGSGQAPKPEERPEYPSPCSTRRRAPAHCPAAFAVLAAVCGRGIKAASPTNAMRPTTIRRTDRSWMVCRNGAPPSPHRCSRRRRGVPVRTSTRPINWQITWHTIPCRRGRLSWVAGTARCRDRGVLRPERCLRIPAARIDPALVQGVLRQPGFCHRLLPGEPGGRPARGSAGDGARHQRGSPRAARSLIHWCAVRTAPSRS
jgi:hypothetical protein